MRSMQRLLRTMFTLALLCAGCWLLAGAQAQAAERRQVLSDMDIAENILDDEEQEMSPAEQRTWAKLHKVYGGNKDTMIKPRPSRVHDRVTFVINDATTTNIEAKTELDTTLSTNWNLQNWFTLGQNSNGNVTLKPYSMTTADGTINTTTQNDNYGQIKMDTSSNHEGEGKTKRKNTFTTKLSGEVIEVLPNGHLVVEAKKAIRVNGETQTVKLVGRVDPNDLNDSSEVDGDRVVDLQVGFSGEGEVTDAIQPGWLSKLVSKFKPF